MDKKYEIKNYEDMTSDEVHALLVEVMQEACTSDEAGPYKSPSVDLSFMDEEPEKEKRRKVKFSRFGKVAAILIIVLLGMNVVMLATEHNVCYSEKGLLHRIFEGTRGIFTDEDETKYVDISETGKCFIINDIEKLDEAKKFWPDLYVPEYIPEGFELDNLEIKKEVSGEYSAEYTYKKGEAELNVIISRIGDENQFYSISDGETIKASDRIINIYTDLNSGSYIADVYLEEELIYLYGDISKKELIDIAKNIY